MQLVAKLLSVVANKLVVAAGAKVVIEDIRSHSAKLA